MTKPKKYTDHPRELEAVKKTMTFEQAREAFWLAFLRVFGQPPAPGPLALLLAHSALETGHWTIGLWNWNFGNVKASESYSGYHQYFRCNEVIDGKVVWFDPPHLQTRFRAHLDAVSGVVEHLQFLAVDTTPHNGKPNRYAAAWDALLRDQPVEYVSELKKAGYFTAGLESYKRSVVSIYNQFLPRCREYHGPAADIPTAHSPMSDIDLTIIATQLEGIARKLKGANK